jgi:hypothetical protein
MMQQRNDLETLSPSIWQPVPNNAERSLFAGKSGQPDLLQTQLLVA